MLVMLFNILLLLAPYPLLNLTLVPVTRPVNMWNVLKGKVEQKMTVTKNPSNNVENLSCDNQVECSIAAFLKRFNRLLDVFFSIALVITVIMSLIVFFTDVAGSLTAGYFATATIHAMGSMLILWTLAELLHAEVRNLHGEKVKVTIFIEVAVAALVRKLLVISTEGATLIDSSVYLCSLLVLGIVYWLLQSKQGT